MKPKKFKLLVLPSLKNLLEVTAKFPFDVELTEGVYKNLEFSFKDNKATITHEGVDLKDFSFVWLSSSWVSRDLAYAVKLYLDDSDTPYSYVEKGTSKVTDHMSFALNNIQSPDTLFLGNKDVQKGLVQIEKTCGYPLVVKDIKGAKGTDSILVNTREELLQEMKKLPKHKKYLFQRFIPNDYDWGVMVVNGKVVSGEKRFPKLGEFRANICNGSTEVFFDPIDIPMKIKQMALDTSKALGLSWSRSDILISRDTNIPYLMEINRRPGLTSKSSEIDGAYKFLSSQIECLAK